jgi:signal peptidase I
MTKLNTTFTSELTPAGVRLLKKVDAGAETEIGTAPLHLPAGKSVHVEFTNVDYRVALRVDDHEVIASTPDQYAPDVEQLLRDYDSGKVYPRPAVQIAAANQKSRVAHLSLWRDVYYLNKNESLQHAIPRDFPNYVVRLSAEPGKEEFFVMGDNSIISGDARYWMKKVDLPAEDLQTEAGRVPGRFMLGKAFFVYWPAGFRPQTSMPGIVPNFGQMRFIH